MSILPPYLLSSTSILGETRRSGTDTLLNHSVTWQNPTTTAVATVDLLESPALPHFQQNREGRSLGLRGRICQVKAKIRH